MDAFGFSWTNRYSYLFLKELKLPKKYYEILAPFHHSGIIDLGRISRDKIGRLYEDSVKVDPHKK